jgi:hypothetical protein
MQNKGKTRKQEQTIAALLAGDSIEAAAVKSGISKRTLLRWMRDPVFAECYDASKRRMLEQTINQLRTIGTEAISALREVANSRKGAAGAKVSAARKILEMLYRGSELEEFETRLERLEEAVRGGENRP